MTALVEARDGTLALQRWRGRVETIAELAPRRRAIEPMTPAVALPAAA
jgi:hypothetical protein